MDLEYVQSRRQSELLASEPVRHILYRFLWPFPYFKGVTRGSKLERVQSYRHNRQMRIHLPGFALKWAVLTLICFGLGTLLSDAAAPVAITACAFITGSWTLVVALMMVAAWCWLTRFPELY